MYDRKLSDDDLWDTWVARGVSYAEIARQPLSQIEDQLTELGDRWPKEHALRLKRFAKAQLDKKQKRFRNSWEVSRV
jgi:hypothetical protein